MKYILFICFFSFFNSCCKESAEEKFKRECPYTLKYSNAHYLKVPINIVPNKIKYNVGDTIGLEIKFSDSISDINTSQIFKIENFPFRPVLEIFNFENGEFISSGFQLNRVLIDTIYHPLYNSSIASQIKYKNNEYTFKAKIILPKKGKYILQVLDLYQINSSGGNPDEWNAKANAIIFEGKCPTFNYDICNMIQGDDHLSEFEPELLHIDKKVFFDNWTTIKLKNHETPFGRGSFAWEFTGTYGFEVE